MDYRQGKRSSEKPPRQSVISQQLIPSFADSLTRAATMSDTPRMWLPNLCHFLAC